MAQISTGAPTLELSGVGLIRGLARRDLERHSLHRKGQKTMEKI
jgi:hypothetical protein